MARKEPSGVKFEFGSNVAWQELLGPFGWTNVTFRYPYGMPHKAPLPCFEVEIELILNEDPVAMKLNEWQRRIWLTNKAAVALETIRDMGYHIPHAPRLEFGGDYIFKLGPYAPTWISEARMTFEVVNNLS